MSEHILLAGFIFCNILTLTYFLRKGYSLKSLLGMMKKGINDTKIIFAVIAFMGVAISIWMASGIVPALVYYGLLYLNGPDFILVAFLITVIVASFMGTAVGTISTIGIALMAIGSSLGANQPLLMGAIVSAAFVADRISPVSSLTNLTLKVTNVEYKVYLRKMMATLLPSLAISGIIFFILGRANPIIANIELIDQFRIKISSIYVISPYLLLVPIAIILMATLGVEVIHNLLIGTIIGGLISLLVQNVGFLMLVKAILFGYILNSPLPEMNKIFHGGGLVPMVELIFIVMGAITFSSILEGTKIVEPVISRIINGSTNRRFIASVTALMSMGLTTITCDQTVGILFIGKYMQPSFEKLGIGRPKLARLIADTGTTVAPLIPWNVNALIILAFTGISVVSFMPFMVLCYVTPIVSLAAIFFWDLKTEKR